MPVTYSQIATQTLGSASSTVTFSSISGTYTDLVAVVNGGSSTDAYFLLRLGTGGSTDTGTNYSTTYMSGSGSVTFSGRASTQSSIGIAYDYGLIANNFNFNSIIHIMNYSNTTTYKTIISRANNAANGTSANVGLWRNTGAIDTVTFLPSSGTFNTGSTFSLYGIKAA